MDLQRQFALLFPIIYLIRKIDGWPADGTACQYGFSPIKFPGGL